MMEEKVLPLELALLPVRVEDEGKDLDYLRGVAVGISEMEGTNPEFAKMKARWETIGDQRERIKRASVDKVYGDDEEIRKGLVELEALADGLEEISASSVSDEVREKLKRLISESPIAINVLRKLETGRLGRSASEPDREIMRTLKSGGNLSEVLGKYIGMARDSGTAWFFLMDKGRVSPDLIRDMSTMGAMFEAEERLRVVDQFDGLSASEKRVARAAVGVKMIEKGVPAGLMREAVCDPERFGPDFCANMVANYLNVSVVSEEREEESRGIISGRRAAKLATVFLAGSMLLSGDVYYRGLSESPKIVQPAGDMGEKPNDGIVSELPRGDDTYGVAQRGDGGGYSQEPTSKIEGEKIEPRNDRVNAAEVASESVIWKMEGNVPNGYYRTATASKFDADSGHYGWKLNVEENLMRELPSLEGKAEFILDAQMRYRSGIRRIDVPVPYGYVPDAGLTFLLVGGKAVGSDYKVWVGRDGTFSLSFESEIYQGVAELKIGMKKSVGEYGVPATWEDENLYLDELRLPPEVQKVMEAARMEAFDSTRARRLQNFLKNKLIYSLNPIYSDYYQKASSGEDFFLRILEVGRTDCDVANSVYLALLRNIGVKARMAYGFNNGGSDLSIFNRGRSELTALEGHGWVEVYENGKWVPFDASPVNMDGYTMNLFGSKAGGGLRGSSPMAEPWKDFKEWWLEQMVRNKGDVVGFADELNAGDTKAWTRLGGGLGLLVLAELGMWAWSNMNMMAFERAIGRFKTRLKEKMQGKSDSYYYQVSGLADEMASELLGRGGGWRKWARRISMLTVVGGQLSLGRETLKVKRMNKTVENAEIHGGTLVEAIAEVSGQSVRKVIESVENQNRSQMRSHIKILGERALLQYVDKKLGNDYKVENTWALDINLDRIVRRAYKFEDFRTRVCRAYYLKTLVAGFPKSFIHERGQKLGGFNGFVEKLPEELGRTLEMYWKTQKK